jgi:hypothetical protein
VSAAELDQQPLQAAGLQVHADVADAETVVRLDVRGVRRANTRVLQSRRHGIETRSSVVF